MDEELMWMLIFGTFVTVIFIIGVYYTLSEFHTMKESDQRREDEEKEEARIDQKGMRKR